MSAIDSLRAVLVAVIWGVAFVVTKYALRELSPALLAALRFAVAAVPVLVLPRPAISWRLLVAMSLTLFLGQFMAQFVGIARGVPPGLAAVIVQSQALFTVALAALALGERPRPGQIAGMAIACVGFAMIAATVGLDFPASAFIIILGSPLSFALGNLLLRRAGPVRMGDLVAWLALVPPLPLLLLAGVEEGPVRMGQALAGLSAGTVASVLFLGIVATSLAYRLWGDLLNRYSAAAVVPYALLVPVVGALASALTFGEHFGPLRLGGMIVVVAGIGLSTLFGRPRPALAVPS